MNEKPSLKEIPLNTIAISSRFRKNYGNIEEMCYSIKKNGQITPIAVSLNPDKTAPQKYILAAGGRRYRAFFEMAKTEEKFKMIQARIYNKVLTELEYRSIELAENIHRKDFDYAEKLKIMTEVQKLQEEIHGKKISKNPTDSGWSQADTAKLLGTSPASITRDLKLAKAIEMIPELGNCKNKSEALKKLGKIERNFITDKQSKDFKKSLKNKDTTQARLINSYIVGDFFERVKQIPAETIDFVEIDPPYAVDLNNKKKHLAYKDKEYNEIDYKLYPKFILNTFKECYRVMKKDSWLICWFGPEPWHNLIYRALTKANFDTHRMCGIWSKNTGQTMSPSTRMGNSYEMFYYAKKGSPVLKKQGRLNVFEFAPVPFTNKYHPTQRPTNLLKEVLKTFCQPNSNILVPFLGSGQTILSAFEVNMNAYGFDLSPDFKAYYTIKVKDDFKDD